ncbi:MAG: PrgI family protein [Candidatus Doudnabacteria bacterium]|nr:PrgI family protein [Candidatus Doudnabacteria bacterium]
MQYALPQFTDIEDKLIGPLTLKQFLSLLATGGLVLFFWSIFKISIFFFFFALPVALCGIFITFGRFNGRSVFTYVLPFLAFMARPRLRIFKRETPTLAIQKSVRTKEEIKKSPENSAEEPGSRLKKLAYLLDQRSLEESKLAKEDI